MKDPAQRPKADRAGLQHAEAGEEEDQASRACGDAKETAVIGDDEELVACGLSDAAVLFYERAKAKGFYNTAPVDIPLQLALIHAEVSEALECWRAGNMTVCVRRDGKPEGFPSELIDVVIHALGLAHALGIDVQEEVLRKHRYNKTRPHMHGKRA